ncbi:unnamed protein product [Sphagnum jensenii]|uniref:Ubiquitin-like protease family profile domain-containing protein n=1 Tax=Sphagnum jensenii TaxID=128206 RepID=A0ABP0X9F3_9BRYO
MVSAVARDRHPKFWNLKLPRMPLTRRAPRPWLPRSLFFLACVRFWRHLRRSGRRLLALSSRRPNQVRASFSLPKLSSAQQRQPGGTRSYGSPPLRPNVAATKEEEDASSRGDWCREAGGGCVDSWFRIPSWRLPADTCLESALASRVSSGVEEKDEDGVGTTRSDGFQGAEPDQRHGYRAKGRKEKLFASRAQWKVKKCEELQKDRPSSLRSLSQFEANALADIMAMDGDEEVMQLKCGDSVRACDMKLLLSGGWLNSEVINTYMTLIEIRSRTLWNIHKKEQKFGRVPTRVCVYNSFFCQKLLTSGYEGVRRWKNKIDWFEYDIIIIPVNYFQSHWALVAVDMQRQAVEYYDSHVHSRAENAYDSVLVSVNEFLKESCIHKFGSHQRLCHWTQEIMEDGVPQQEDASSCGVYICVFADLLARGLEPPFSFSQKDIFQIRQGIAAELLAARGS